VRFFYLVFPYGYGLLFSNYGKVMIATNNSVNWLGLKTLYIKEVNRFLKVYNQTLLAPAVNAMLLLAVFSLAIGSRVQAIGDVPFAQFMVPGLIMMTVVQNAFANTSSSLIMGKVLGTYIDLLMPPISAGEMTLAMVGGGITRGIMSGAVVSLTASFFVTFTVHDIWLFAFYMIFASSLLSLLGIISGIFADSFDQMHAITSYIITPLAFLSGTFYSVKNLPEFWQKLNHLNPFFYIIDGFRYSMTGHNDADIFTGVIALLVSTIILYALTYFMLKSGYRLKN